MVWGKIVSMSFYWDCFIYSILYFWGEICLSFGFDFRILKFYTIYWTMDNEYFANNNYCRFNWKLDDSAVCFNCGNLGSRNREQAFDSIINEKND